MTIKNGTPLSWFPKGLSDAVDSTPVFPGAMGSLKDLIPDPSTKNVWYCRPASTLQCDFEAHSAGAFSSAFSSAFDIGFAFSGLEFVSLLRIVGTRAYGMISNATYPGFDIPFSFNIATGTFDAISGISGSNIPNSPLTTGAWTPPTADVIGTFLVITHPGFDTTNGYFGWIDISDPSNPVWDSGNTASTALAAVPVAVKQFNGRAWFLVNPAGGQPAAYFTDVLDPLTITSGTQILTFGDNVTLTALGQLPLNNQLGGIVQALIVFKGVTNMYQVTGDAAALPNSTLTINALNIATGTLSPNSICTTPKGMAFIAPDGLRILDFNAHISDPIGLSGMGVTVPFIYSVVPSRVAAACNLSIIRITVQNGAASGNPTQEYWYDIARDLWSGPHSFPASLIQAYSNTFIMTPVGVLSKLFQSDAIQTATSTFVENGAQMSWTYQTASLPNTGRIASNYVSEVTVDAAFTSGSTYAVSAYDNQMATLDTVLLTSNLATGAVWGSFIWGSATWGVSSTRLAPQKVNWHLPLVIDQFFLSMTGNSAQVVKLGKWYMRYSVLGYLQSNAA